MKYDIKAIINGAEIMDKAEPGRPSITGVALMNSVSSGALEIGSVAIDKLTLTLINPYKSAFDGDTVELWIAPNEDGDGTDRIGELETLVGSESEEESIDDNDSDIYEEEEEEEGEDLSEEELAETETEEAALRGKIVEQVEGESLENEEVTTDEAAENAWKKVGTFFVYGQKSTSEGLQLECFDSTIFLHGTYMPAKATDTVQNHFDSFRAACQEETGIPVEPFTFDGVYNKTITWDFSCSYRDAIGYFAGLAGGFAHADENGEIGISFYLTDDTILLKEELMDYREESSGEIVIDGMSCNRSRTTNLTSDVIETGAGQSVSWTNPFVDEDILEDIFSQYRGTRYIGAAVSCKWDLSLQAGNLIRIMSEAEYENWLRMRNAAESAEDDSSIRAEMATQGKIILIGTQTVKFAGEAITTIKSARAAETARENEMTSPWKKSAMELADETATAQSTADDARAEATLAQSTATAASRAANSAARAAATAQSKADEASTAAATAQTKADEASAAASTAQSSAATAAQAAATAQSTADAAKASASSAASAASAAQTKANEAASAAATAQSKADSAGTAASKAQSSANAAGEAASSAQAAAEAAQVAAGAAQADIDSQKEHFWHDENGAHVLGSKTAARRYRTDIDSEGMHIRDVSAEIQEVAKFTADGAQIGNAANAHQNMDYNSWKLTDKEGNVFAEVKDLRGTDGIAEITEFFYNTDQDEEGQFFITYPVISITGVSVDDVKANYSVDPETGNLITLEKPLSDTSTLKVTYKTTESFYTYTFGIRNKEGATGAGSFAEGHDVEARGWFSHAEGELSYAGGIGAHAESNSQALGNSSHAETGAVAEGDYSHAERGGTATGDSAHAGGFGAVAGYDNQTAIGTYNDNKADSLFEIGNGTDGDERSNAFRVTKDGKVHDGERCLSDIGTVYMAEKDVAITTASINTRVKGATITVPAGIYVVCGEWIFNTSSTTGARNINLDINVGENMEARSRVYANAKNYASLHASTIVMLDATTELSVRGSSSEKSPAERTRIRAVRVK